MEEVYTCECGEQDHWTVYDDKIQCSLCRRVYRFGKHMSPGEFNKTLEERRIKEA